MTPGGAARGSRRGPHLHVADALAALDAPRQQVAGEDPLDGLFQPDVGTGSLPMRGGSQGRPTRVTHPRVLIEPLKSQRDAGAALPADESVRTGDRPGTVSVGDHRADAHTPPVRQARRPPHMTAVISLSSCRQNVHV